MTIVQLKYVIVLAGAASMREAASQLFISQPALSSTIRELEEELGIQIFERNNKGVSLTDVGREFLAYAKQAVSQYKVIEDRYIDKWKDKPIQKWSAIALTSLMSFYALSNYKIAGVLIIYVFYYYQEHYLDKPYLQKLLIILGVFVVYLPLYHWARFNFCDYATYMAKLQGDNTFWYLTHIPIACLIASYKGELGPISHTFKKIYKVFYPAHLFILGVIYQFFY